MLLQNENTMWIRIFNDKVLITAYLKKLEIAAAVETQATSDKFTKFPLSVCNQLQVQIVW